MGNSEWKERVLSVKTLQLDPKNPRIPGIEGKLNQTTILNDLVFHEDIYDLATKIAKNGFLPLGTIVVEQRKRKFFVVEGNRRLAALKLLLNPEKSPKKFESRFRTLSAQVNKKSIEKIKTLICPDRESAIPILLTRHVDREVSSWAPLMQAKFYKQMIDEGITVDDISKNYSVKKSDVIKSLQMYNLYLIAINLEYPQKIADVVKNPRKFYITTLQRFYNNSNGKRFLNIEFISGTGDFKCKTTESEFKKALAKVVTDIATLDKSGNSIITSRINIANYINENLSEYATKEYNTLLSSVDILNGMGIEPGNDADTNKQIPKKKNDVTTKTKKRSPIIPDGMYCELRNQRVNYIFNELKQLPYSKYPNAWSVMLRVLLELGLSYFVKNKGYLSGMIEQEKESMKSKNQKFNNDWTPSLRQMIVYLTNNNVLEDSKLTKSLQRFISEKNQVYSLDTCNLFVHNEEYFPTEDRLRTLWSQLQGLFNIILVEID